MSTRLVGREPTKVHDRAMRRMASLAVVLGIAHLLWVLWSGLGPLWVSLPFVLLEAWGIAQFALRTVLVWQPVPERVVPSAEGTSTNEGARRLVDVVITCTFQEAEELEQTLVAARSLRGANQTIVAIQSARPDLIDVIGRFDVDVRIVDGNHVDGFWEAARLSEFALWLVAGQVPTPGCIEMMGHELDDADVAFVQADVGLHNTDSFAHVRGGRDEDAFHRRVVQPILGARGAASWRGGGSLVRISAIADTGGIDGNDQAALERATVRMQAAGRRSRYCGEPVVVRGAAPDSLGEYLMLRRRTAIETLRVFRTPENPLRHGGLTPQQRIDHAARAIGFTSSLRQLGLALLLAAVLFTGAVPFGSSVAMWAALWVPLQLVTIRANRLLARGTMERGDWTRQGWRTVAADINAFTTVLGFRRKVATFYRTSGSGFGAIDKMRLTTAVVILLDAAVIARGLTLIWPRLLPRFSLSGRVMAMGLGLIVIVVIVDVLQVAVRRKQRRSSFRLSTDLVATLDDQLVQVIDLSVAGLGAQLHTRDCPFEVGQSIRVMLRLPANTGSEQRLEFNGQVRSIVARQDHYRLGLSFDELSADVRTGLISYCAVGHHEMGDGYSDANDLHPAQFEVSAPKGNLVKLCSAVAMITGVGVLFAGPAAPKALADVLAPVSVCLHTSTGEPLSDGQVGFQYDEAWHSIGATGLNGCIEGQLPATKTRVEMVHRGIRVVKRQDLAANPVVDFTTTAVEVELTAVDGLGLEGGIVEFRSAGAWRSIGTTDSVGTASAELLASKRAFAVTFDGIRATRKVDLREVERVSFSRVPVSISLHDSAGAPVAGAAAGYRGVDWTPIGQTDQDGVARTELLPGTVRFEMLYEGGRTTIRQDLAVDADVPFSMRLVDVEFRTASDEAIAGATIELRGDGWRTAGETNAAGVLQIEALPETRSFRITHDGRTQQIRQDVATDPIVRFRTVPATVEVTSADGSPLANVPIEIRGSGWRELGSTDESGRVTLEALPTMTRFRGRHGGITSTGRWNLGSEPDISFSTETAVVRVQGSSGEPLAGVEVQVRTVGWNQLGVTNEQGEVPGEFLPSRIRFRAVIDGVRTVVVADTRESPVITIDVSTELADGPDDDEEEPADSAAPQETVDEAGIVAGSTTTTTAPQIAGQDQAPTTNTMVLETPTTEPPTSSTVTSDTTTPTTSTTAAPASLATDPSTTTTETTTTETTTTETTTTETTTTETTTSEPTAQTTAGLTTTSVLSRALSAPSRVVDGEPPDVEQAVAARSVLATPGKVFESEAVATALSWSSPDFDSQQLLEATLEDAAIYNTLESSSTIGYAFRFDNPTDDDLADGTVVELRIPGAVDLANESDEEWSCERADDTWRCAYNGVFEAASSSTIRVAATLPAPEVVAFEPRDSTGDLVTFGATVTGLIGLLYLAMLRLDRGRR